MGTSKLGKYGDNVDDDLMDVDDLVLEQQQAEKEDEVDLLKKHVAELQAEREILRQQVERLAEYVQARDNRIRELYQEEAVWRERYFQTVVVLAELAREYEL